MTAVVGRLPDWVTAWYLFTRNTRWPGICTTETTNLLAHASAFQCVAFSIDKKRLNRPIFCHQKLIKAQRYVFQQITGGQNGGASKIVVIRYICQSASEATYGGLRRSSQSSFPAAFLEVCRDLAGHSALQQQRAHQRGWSVCLDGEVEQGLRKHSSNSSRLGNYAWPNLSGSFLTVLTAAHTNRCLLIFPSFHLQKKSGTTCSTNSPPPLLLDSFSPWESKENVHNIYKHTRKKNKF